MKYLLFFSLLLLAPLAFAAQTLPVTVRTNQGDVPLTLELATTPAIREQGLMNRDTLAPNDGMLFLFPKANRVAFWMKNTRIPLDILFVDAKGHIVHIAHKTTPYSETPIDSTKPVNTVIELAGGQAEAKKLQEGDSVIYSLPAGIHAQ